MTWNHEELTRTIIGVYYDVYNGTGRTYPEFIYERAMFGDLLGQGVRCRRQEEYEIRYKEKPVGRQQLDLFVAQEVVVEIKVAPALTNLHKAQAISYLKTSDKETGLLFNFGSAKPQFMRLFRPNRSGGKRSPGTSVDYGELLSPELTEQVIGALYEVHTILGPGFIHRIYARAVYHELRLRGCEVLARHAYQVIYRGRPLDEIKFNHLQVDSSVMVFPVAIEDINRVSILNLKAWMAVQRIPLGIVANFHPASLEFFVLRG